MKRMSLKLIIIKLFFLVFLFSVVYAQENITITTYYPSPYGSYDELEANSFQTDKIVIDSTANAAYAATIPDGTLELASLAAAPGGAAGRIYYNSTSDELYYHNGSSWVSLRPAPATLVFYDSGDTITNCVPSDTHVVAILTTSLRGARMDSPPQSGYLICH